MTSLLPRRRLDAAIRDPDAVGLTISCQPLRRDPQGGIDYGYYFGRARSERSKAAHALVRGLGRGLARLFSRGAATSHPERGTPPRF